jgi:hypothetical protein
LGGLFNLGTAPVQASQEVTPTVAPTRESLLTPAGDINSVPQGQVANPFSGDYLTQAAQATPGLFSGLFLALSLALLGAGLYYYFVGKNQWRRVHKLNYQLANTWSVIAMSLGGLGVLFMIFRFAGIEGLNMRFWAYLLLLVMVGFAGYALYYFRMVYPPKLAEYNKTHKGKPVTTARVATPRATGAVSAEDALREAGSAGNPRGTSARGARRREKR